MAKQKILCGLDIGTNSVGWCVTDENNKVIKKQGKSLWGVRMFEEAKDSKERRGFRSSRRRLKRRKERLSLLQSLFSIPMNEVDASFFYRLSNSFYHNEDREHPFQYTLFNSVNYTDKQYYDEFPTIYHLRKHLLESKEKEDLRFIYLALHHMIKYRGNFLSEGTSFKPLDKESADSDFRALQALIEEESRFDGENISYDDTIFEELKIANKNIKRLGDLQDRFNELLNPLKNGFIKSNIIPLMLGKKIKIKNLKLEDSEEKLELKEICPADENYEDNIQLILASYPEEENLVEILLLLQKIYQFFLLGKLLGDHQYLCNAMVERYEKHHNDLKQLKAYIRKYHNEDYGRLFRKPRKKGEKEEANYSSYVGSYIVNGEEPCRFGRGGKQEEFFKLIKSILAQDNNQEAKDIIQSIDNKDYLPLLNSTSNGVFPYQLNLLEMKVILENQSKHYEFLNERDEDGTIAEKIISLLTFKIPYYVGPLSSKANHSWIVRKEGKIYPWNFYRMVKKDDTAAEFIKRMLNRCSYLPSEYCLPKDSLIFTYYNVLSFLNKLQVNGDYLDYEEKMELISLFKAKRKVNVKEIENFFKHKNPGTEVSITTSNGKGLSNIACNMSSYYDFANIYSPEYVDSHTDEIEAIIQDIVIFEDKQILEERLKNTHGIEDISIIKKIKGLNYTKYGRLSKELLVGLKAANQETGELYGSILHIMEHSNMNLQEIIHAEEFNFQALIDDYNQTHSSSDKKDTIEGYVDTLYVNPGMRRGLIQAYKIIEELEKILKRPIDEFYVECARTNKEKKQPSSSRKQKLITLYNEAIKATKDAQELKRLLDHLENMDENQFQSDKFYLYFLQMGRCMYSGDPIEIESLFDTSKYDIDHIIPQSLTKDDSFNNRVLVKQELNRDKKAIYPIESSLLFHGNRDKAFAFYRHLKDMGLMSEDKFEKLRRTQPLKDEEYAAFANRQLVYTNQAVAGLISAIQYFKRDSGHMPRIIYSKAENVSDFRKVFELVKSRTANNFHHAHDAYLNIIVGRTLDSYFSPFKQNKDTIHQMHLEKKTTNPLKVFTADYKVFDLSGNLVWDKEKSLQEIRHQLYECYDILTTTRTYQGTTLFEKVTIYKKGEGNIGVKASGPLANASEYGGLNGYAFGFYTLIKTDKNYILEAIPTLFKNNIKGYLDTLYKEEYEIIIPKLNINSVVLEGKKKYCITGKTGDCYLVKNLLERRFTYQELIIIHKLEKIQERLTKNKVSLKGNETEEDLKKFGLYLKENYLIVSIAKNKDVKQIELSYDECSELYESLNNILNKEIYAYSASSTISTLLNEQRDYFEKSSIALKIKVLLNLLAYLKCNERKSIDLTLIYGKSKMGTLYLGKKIKPCKIIAESITGFYTKVIWEIK